MEIIYKPENSNTGGIVSLKELHDRQRTLLDSNRTFRVDSNLKHGDTAIPMIIDHTFNRGGRKWRVSVVADTFVIGTAVDAQLDTRGEPVRDSDIIKVML